MLSEHFRDVIANYATRTGDRFIKDAFVAQVLDDIPAILKNSLRNGAKFEIKGSVGTGGWAETPWVAVLDPKVTTTVQQGYYVCYLINPKQKTMYLGLAVGWTQFAEKFPAQEAQRRIADYSRYLLRQLRGVPDNFSSGIIDLSAEHNLSKGYEQGQILYIKYEISDLTDDTLYSDLETMLNLYTQLRDLVGNDIQNISYDKVMAGGTIDDTEKIANKITLENNLERVVQALEGLHSDLPPKRVEHITYRVARNPKIARLVKESKGYICELCGRKPFIQKNGKLYAEADHIRPLGGASKGLDTPANIRCLCAQCHAVVTHGSDDEIRRLVATYS